MERTKPSQNKPYPRRSAFPISFYPMLSAEFDVNAEQVAAFLKTSGPGDIPDKRSLIYVHIPFCRTICRFCGFYRKRISEFQNQTESTLWDKFTDNLLREIDYWSEIPLIENLDFQAVYIGGGTPSLMPPAHIQRLLGKLRSVFKLRRDTEITFEGEVLSIGNAERLGTLREHGVKRISFGVQSFTPEVRKLVNLQPGMDDILNTCELLRKYDYPLSIDLMYDLPGQNLKNFANDLDIAVNVLNVDHVDLYDNILYPNSELFNNREKYFPLMPSEAQSLEMIDLALHVFQEHGFKQITCDDFVKPGHEYVMKNLTYGTGTGHSQILALGPTAVGFLAGAIYRNNVLEPYLSGEIKSIPIQRLRRSTKMQKQTRPFVFFPKRLILDRKEMIFPPTERSLDILQSQIRRDLVEDKGNGVYCLTRSGKKWAENMMLEQIDGPERRRLYKIVQ